MPREGMLIQLDGSYHLIQCQAVLLVDQRSAPIQGTRTSINGPLPALPRLIGQRRAPLLESSRVPGSGTPRNSFAS